MARTLAWSEDDTQHGVITYTLKSWEHFATFVDEEFLDFREFIYRGQASAKWKLEPTLDRTLRPLGKLASAEARKEHLDQFKMAARGRRGPNPPNILQENDWWALGQHHGLSTPLLDWTKSPFAAAYFAFTSEENEKDRYRAVWALSVNAVSGESAAIAKRSGASSRPPIVEFVRPMSDDNARLVSQNGLFTRSPDGIDIESWVRQNWDRDHPNVVLGKILLPNRNRERCLRNLNRMNINHASLFPDLYGASKFCNFDLMIQNY